MTDKEATTTAVQISDLRPARNQGSVGGYREIMRDQLFSDMFGARLDELARSANPPFVSAAADRELFPAPRTRDVAMLQAIVSNDGVTRGLAALVTELQRLSRFGFTATELARAKQAMMLSYERSVTESPDRESASRADEYTRNFLQGEALPTIWQELAFHRRFLPGITLAEVNKLTDDWFPADNRLIVVAAPDAAGIVLPDERQLAAAVSAAPANRLTAYVDTAAGQTLMESKPAAGTIVKTTEHPEAGITEWTLSNGATVVLKPTTLREDQILFQAFAPGGTSLASDAEFVPARVADASRSGRRRGTVQRRHARQDPFEQGDRRRAVYQRDWKKGCAEAARRRISRRCSSCCTCGSRSRAPIRPRLPPSRRRHARCSRTRWRARRSCSTRRSLAALSGNSPRLRPETPATVDQWDLAKSLAFYKARFADASNFTFVFVGSFTPDTIRPLVETYLASLPATHAHETWRDLVVGHDHQTGGERGGAVMGKGGVDKAAALCRLDKDERNAGGSDGGPIDRAVMVRHVDDTVEHGVGKRGDGHGYFRSCFWTSSVRRSPSETMMRSSAARISLWYCRSSVWRSSSRRSATVSRAS